MTFDTLCAPRYAPELDIIVRELDRLADRLVQLAAHARSLSETTDWHAEAARAFFLKADRWSGSVMTLGHLAESARREAVDARAFARARVEWSCS